MKIHKTKFIKGFFCLVLLGIVLGCDDDEFLDIKPESFFTTDNAFTSAEQLETSLITLYSRHRRLFYGFDSGTSGKQGRIFQGQGTDVMTTPGFRAENQFSDYSQINSEHQYTKFMYERTYQHIGFANTTLSVAEQEGISYESESQKRYIIAQARFFRAWAHGNLAELFGNVAIVDEVVNAPRFDYEQRSRADVYTFAINELEAILADLPETTDQPGRVVRGAAQHYLSQYYLGRGIETGNNADYTQAVAHASSLIDGGIYSLVENRFGSRMNEPGKDVYWDLFRIDNQNYSASGNTESIWAHQIDFGAYLAGDTRVNKLEFPRYYSPVWRVLDCVDGVAEDVGGRGVAYFRPSNYVQDVIWEPAISDGDIRGAESNIRRTILYNDPACPAVLGQPVPQAEIDAGNVALPGSVYPIFEKLTTDQFVGLDEGQNRSNLFRDNYIIRLAETILLRAEAKLRLGDNQGCADDINLLRNRANCTVLATAGTVDIDFILDERARELFGEEQRWNTLLRMGGTVAVDRIRQYATHDWTTNTLTFDFNLLPIPQSSIDRNKDVIWTQNPGWENK